MVMPHAYIMSPQEKVRERQICKGKMCAKITLPTSVSSLQGSKNQKNCQHSQDSVVAKKCTLERGWAKAKSFLPAPNQQLGRIIKFSTQDAHGCAASQENMEQPRIKQLLTLDCWIPLNCLQQEPLKSLLYSQRKARKSRFVPSINWCSHGKLHQSTVQPWFEPEPVKQEERHLQGKRIE